MNAYLRRRSVTSWQTAAWSRPEVKLPEPDELFGASATQSQKEPQSEDELNHAVNVWNSILSRRVEE